MNGHVVLCIVGNIHKNSIPFSNIDSRPWKHPVHCYNRLRMAQPAHILHLNLRSKKKKKKIIITSNGKEKKNRNRRKIDAAARKEMLIRIMTLYILKVEKLARSHRTDISSRPLHWTQKGQTQ